MSRKKISDFRDENWNFFASPDQRLQDPSLMRVKLRVIGKLINVNLIDRKFYFEHPKVWLKTPFQVACPTWLVCWCVGLSS